LGLGPGYHSRLISGDLPPNLGWLLAWIPFPDLYPEALASNTSTSGTCPMLPRSVHVICFGYCMFLAYCRGPVGASWGLPGASWEPLGAVLGTLGCLLSSLWGSWRNLGLPSRRIIAPAASSLLFQDPCM